MEIIYAPCKNSLLYIGYLKLKLKFVMINKIEVCRIIDFCIVICFWYFNSNFPVISAVISLVICGVHATNKTIPCYFEIYSSELDLFSKNANFRLTLKKRYYWILQNYAVLIVSLKAYLASLACCTDVSRILADMFCYTSSITHTHITITIIRIIHSSVVLNFHVTFMKLQQLAP